MPNLFQTAGLHAVADHAQTACVGDQEITAVDQGQEPADKQYLAANINFDQRHQRLNHRADADDGMHDG